MLIRWITTGHLSDPFDEFMVKESGHITKGVLESDYTDEYWERRYTVSWNVIALISVARWLFLGDKDISRQISRHVRRDSAA
jgi:gamma-tubulin complex component 2